MVPGEQLSTIPDLPLSGTDHPTAYPVEAPPIFFGHYWLNGKPSVQTRNAVCLDYSAGKDGSLVAYQWHDADGQSRLGCLHDDQFVTVD